MHLVCILSIKVFGGISGSLLACAKTQSEGQLHLSSGSILSYLLGKRQELFVSGDCLVECESSTWEVFPFLAKDLLLDLLFDRDIPKWFLGCPELLGVQNKFALHKSEPEICHTTLTGQHKILLLWVLGLIMWRSHSDLSMFMALICMYVCMYACMHACLSVCLYVCM